MRFSEHLLNYFFTFIILLFAGRAFAVTISVTTDRSPAVINESFQIIFEADDSVDDEPDFSPLHKDFQITSTSISSNMSIINGRISSTKQWQLSVLAKRAGELTIPAIAFGKDRSQATTMTVASSRTAAGNRQHADRNLFVEVQANTLKPQVQSQVLYTVKLYRSLTIANASLSEPEVSGGDAVIERLGEDQSYDSWIEGRRYIVVERNYAIYPQASGRLTLAPIRLRGQLVQDRFSMFDPFAAQARTVIRQSEPITLEVQAVPSAFTGGHWLPAKNVSLQEQWSGNPMALQVGEPITRTLLLTAAGQTASQLPELPLWSLPDFKQYPDQAALSDDKTRTGITGTRQEKTAIIPNKPGNYTLPAIRLPWWNTEKSRLEHAELPERQIVVLAAADNINNTNKLSDFAPPPLGDLDADNSSNKVESLGEQTAAGPEARTVKTSHAWQYVSLALGLVWLVTLLLWWRSGRQDKRQARAGNNAALIGQVRKDIKQACQHHDAEKTKEYLLQWAHLHWAEHPPMSIGEIGRRSSKQLAAEIDLLANSLYSARSKAWNGSDFWVAFANESFKQQKEKQKGRLEPLYRL